MKTLKILIALFFVGGVAVAQDIKKAAVPAVVTDAFAKEYTKATDVEWEKDLENFKVEFDVARMDHEVWYDASGTVVKKKQDIEEAALPQAVRDALQSSYVGFRAEDIEKIWYKNSTSYKLDLEKDNSEIDLIFDANGKVTSEYKH